MSAKRPKRARLAGRSDPAPRTPHQVVPARTPRDWRLWLLCPALLVVTLAAYHPAWHGGVLWDDNHHLTRGELQPLAGLWRIWFDVGATQQYYPVVHSAFWLMHALWGDHTLGYHLVNIVLHVSSACLVAVILRRLAIPGAFLAALIFAVHPVQVESVAWITELKNTLSGVCYLAAALTYLHYDTSRRTRLYAVALALFVLALLSKSVTATLPAALLVVFWWQRGHLRWRKDVRPLLPFFVLGIGGGLVTAWLERTQIGAQGAAFQFTPVERCLIAGRAIWFYLGKLLWPANLIFSYPRWQISQHVWWQYLYPLAVVVLLFGLWRMRRQSRAPLAAMLFFIGTLFPALGFVNVFPFRYSLVADHFQYLASLGIIALFSAGAVNLAKRWSLGPAVAATAAVVLFGAPLSALTWAQSGQYANAETLYRTTIAGNPDCWMAYNNLGSLKLDGSIADVQEAVAEIQTALRINPNDAEAHNNLGYAWQRLGRFADAVGEHQEALRLKPDLTGAYNNLGAALLAIGRPDEAIAQYTEALRLQPNDAGIRANLGLALARAGRSDTAVALLSQAVTDHPDSADAHTNLGASLQKLGRLDQAVTEFREAVRLKPDFADAHTNLGAVFVSLGRMDEAAREFGEALRLSPGSAKVTDSLGYVALRLGHLDEAIARFKDAILFAPDYARAHYDLANAFEELGRHEEAIAEFKVTLQHQPDFADAHNDLGVALAELGRYAEAVTHFKEALRLKPDLADARENLAKAQDALRKGKGLEC